MRKIKLRNIGLNTYEIETVNRNEHEALALFFNETHTCNRELFTNVKKRTLSRYITNRFDIILVIF